MVEIKNLVKQYGDIKAVNDISFTVNDGDSSYKSCLSYKYQH